MHALLGKLSAPGQSKYKRYFSTTVSSRFALYLDPYVFLFVCFFFFYRIRGESDLMVIRCSMLLTFVHCHVGTYCQAVLEQ